MRVEIYAKKVAKLPERCLVVNGFAIPCPDNIPAFGRVLGRKDAEAVIGDSYELWSIDTDLADEDPEPMTMDIGVGVSIPINVPMSATCSLVIERDDA